MIKNERQYKITKASAKKFAEALTVKRAAGFDVDPMIAKASYAAAASQLEELKQQIGEYEALRSGSLEILEVESLEDLPSMLIKARIAANLSQRELAARLNLKEQQIQRYEETDYAGASLAKLIEISRALHLKVKHEAVLGANPSNVEKLLGRLGKVGLPKDLLTRRLVSRDVVQGYRDDPDRTASVLISDLVANLKRIFGWSNTELLGTTPLTFASDALGSAQFKLRERRNEKRVSAYTVYAHYLAMLVLQSTRHCEARKLPNTPQDFYDNVCLQYQDMTFENALRYVWSLGIAVLPLEDEGAFDGAYWRVQGRHVIVLKQNSHSASRWLFDLLHDYRHATQRPHLNDSEVVELPPTSEERREAPDEVDASNFAGEVILAGHDKELIRACELATGGRLPRLKAVLPDVAKEIGVDISAAANFMAYQLSLDGTNWWGTAANLQAVGESPWLTARNVFLEHVKFGALSAPDRRLLVDALTEEEREYE